MKRVDDNVMIKTPFGEYYVPLKLEDQFRKELKIVQSVDLIFGGKKSHFNSTYGWGKYQVEKTQRNRIKASKKK